MPLETRTHDELVALARAIRRSLIPGADVSQFSDYDIASRMEAAFFLGNQQQGEFLASGILPDNADAELLERHGRVRGIFTLLATLSTGTIHMTAPSGTDLQASGSLLTHDDGTVYATTAAATMALPAWTGKTIGAGSSDIRILVAPNVTGMVANDLITVEGNVRAIRAVLTDVDAIDLYEPLPKTPSEASAITATRGAAAVPVIAQAGDEGSAGNKPQGDSITLNSPTGVIDAVVRVIRLSGGAEDETLEELRTRILGHIQSPPAGANAGFYRDFARKLTTQRVGDAMVFMNFRGLATVDIIPLGPAGARFPSPQMITEVDAAIDALAPEADDRLTLAPTLTAAKEVTLSVTPEVGFEPDWTGAFKILGTSTTTRLDLNADPTDIIEVGDRILHNQKVGANWVVFERTVSALGVSFVDLDKPLPSTPIVNPDARDDVLPSGPLGLPVLLAVEGVFDSLGPGTGAGAGAVFDRLPEPSVEFDDVLRLSKITAAVQAVEGTRDVTITTVNDLTPANIVPAAQELIRLGQISVTHGVL